MCWQRCRGVESNDHSLVSQITGVPGAHPDTVTVQVFYCS